MARNVTAEEVKATIDILVDRTRGNPTTLAHFLNEAILSLPPAKHLEFVTRISALTPDPILGEFERSLQPGNRVVIDEERFVVQTINLSGPEDNRVFLTSLDRKSDNAVYVDRHVRRKDGVALFTPAELAALIESGEYVFA